MEVGGTHCTGTYDLLTRYDSRNGSRNAAQRKNLVDTRKHIRANSNSSAQSKDLPQSQNEVEKKLVKENPEIPKNEAISLYATLSEKNQIIQALKQRLMNQQLQLAYYLHKNLFNENILEFSSHCTPRINDQNIELTLAMCNYMKDTQGTKKLCKLHEKLNEYDQKVSEILSKQEEIVKSACDVNNDQEEDTSHSDIYRKIMNTTKEVKKELAELRNCSEQINCLETEKNALVDFIFKIPEQENPNSREKVCNQLRRNVSKTDLSIPSTPKEIIRKEMDALRSENEKLNSILETITEASNPFRVLELEAKCVKIERDLEDVRKGLELEVESKEEEVNRLLEELKLASDQSCYLEEQLVDLRASVNLVVEENELLQSALEKFNEAKEGEALERLQEIIRSQKEQIRKLVLLICNLKEDDSFLEGDLKLSLSSRNGEIEEVEDSGLFSAKTEYPLEDIEGPKESKIDLNLGNEYIESVPSKTSFHSKQYTSTNYVTSSKQMRDCCQMADLNNNNNNNNNKMTTTSLEVESFDKNGKKESLRATLESTTQLGGILEMDNSSNLRLRLHCYSGNKNDTMKQAQSLCSVVQKEEGVPKSREEASPSREYAQKISRGKQAIVNNIKRIYSHILGQ